MKVVSLLLAFQAILSLAGARPANFTNEPRRLQRRGKWVVAVVNHEVKSFNFKPYKMLVYESSAVIYLTWALFAIDIGLMLIPEPDPFEAKKKALEKDEQFRRNADNYRTSAAFREHMAELQRQWDEAVAAQQASWGPDDWAYYNSNIELGKMYADGTLDEMYENGELDDIELKRDTEVENLQMYQSGELRRIGEEVVKEGMKAGVIVLEEPEEGRWGVNGTTNGTAEGSEKMYKDGEVVQLPGSGRLSVIPGGKRRR